MDLKTYIETRGERGTGQVLARAIGVSQVIISQWKTGARIVPAERCPDIERATGGQVKCEELRPDLADQWAFLRGTDKQESVAPPEIVISPVLDECGSGDPRHGVDRREPDHRATIDRRHEKAA